MGSEMCIRDSLPPWQGRGRGPQISQTKDDRAGKHRVAPRGHEGKPIHLSGNRFDLSVKTVQADRWIVSNLRREDFLKVVAIFHSRNERVVGGPSPPRVQPTIGEWGPVKVPTTKQKRRMRIWVTLALLGALVAIFLLGWYVYYLMTGSLGFGIGDERQFFAAFLL